MQFKTAGMPTFSAWIYDQKKSVSMERRIKHQGNILRKTTG
jgi:hypothetical protein